MKECDYNPIGYIQNPNSNNMINKGQDPDQSW